MMNHIERHNPIIPDEDKRPTPKEERDEKLAYALNSLIDVPQILHFQSVKAAVNWLTGLKKEGITQKLLGIWITKSQTYILAKIKKSIEWRGREAIQQGKIWLQAPTPQSCNIESYGRLRTGTSAKKDAIATPSSSENVRSDSSGPKVCKCSGEQKRAR
jgi:hypothetical protein